MRKKGEYCSNMFFSIHKKLFEISDKWKKIHQRKVKVNTHNRSNKNVNFISRLMHLLKIHQKIVFASILMTLNPD